MVSVAAPPVESAHGGVKSMNELLVTVGGIVALLTILLTFAAMLTWGERRLLGLWQDRYGPIGSARSACSRWRRT